MALLATVYGIQGIGEGEDEMRGKMSKSGSFRVNLIIKRYVEGVIHPVPGKQFGKQWHHSR